MALAELIIRVIDWFYIRPVAAVLPRQVFRYVVCGGVIFNEGQHSGFSRL